MPELDLVTQIAEAIYQIQPQRIKPLPPLLDWRGIYRIHDPRGRVWLLRLLRLPHAADALAESGRLLQWLEQQAQVDSNDLMIRKMQARFAATAPIARIAVHYLEEELR